jgi:hypothetical protein
VIVATRKFSNQYRRSRNRYPGRGGCLTNTQKAAICILAREAFAEIGNRKRGNSEISDVSFQLSDLSAWRHEQCFLAVGKDSLRDCVQGDYKKLFAHFLNLKGEPGRAVKAHMEVELEAGAIAMRKLERECAARGLELSYPAAICRNKFKCGLDEATPRQLWVLVFDVRTSKHKKLTTDHTDKTDSDFRTSDSSVKSVVDYPF